MSSENPSSVFAPSPSGGLGDPLTFFARCAFAVFAFAVIPAGAGAT